MKCKYCLAEIDSSEPFCPTCGKKNPLANPTTASTAPFRLDEEPEVKASSIPNTPPRSSVRRPAPSASPAPRSGAGKQSQGCCLILVAIFILFILINIIAVIFTRM